MKQKNLEPRIPGLSRRPSTCFCILYKLFTMKLTKKQLLTMFDSEDVRVLGLAALYLRYIGNPLRLWQWLEHYIEDDREISAAADASVMSVSEFLVKLLREDKYFNTNLPRIPQNILKIYKRELLKREIMRKRDTANEWIREKLKVGEKVKAQYEADQKFYTAKLDEVLYDGSFLVTFIDYDEQAEVSIGMLKMEKKRRRSRSRSDRDRKRRRDSKGGDRRRDRRSRDRGKDRKDRDRSRRSRDSGRSRRDRDRRGGDLETASSHTPHVPEVLTDEVLDKMIQERESERYLSRNAYDVIRPKGRAAGDGRGATNFEVATLRKRTPSPERKRHLRPAAKPVVRKRQIAKDPLHAQKMATLMAKYGAK